MTSVGYQPIYICSFDLG